MLRLFGFIYFTLLLYVTVFSRRFNAAIDYRRLANLTPFKTKHSFKYSSNTDIFFYFAEIIGNFLLFLPFAAAVFFICKKKIPAAILVVLILVTTICIEACQYIFNVGVLDINDIFLNFIGGIIGMFLFNIYTKKGV